MGVTKKDSIPSELVARHMRDWLKHHDGDLYHAYRALSARSGLNPSTFAKLNTGSNRYRVSFDTADRMFCAMGRPNIWYCDDELQEHYLRVVPEADRMYPLEPMEIAA